MPLLRTEKLKDLFENDETFATTLAAVVFDEFGTEAVEWDPDTVRLELRKMLNADVPQVNIDKLFTIFTILASNQFQQDPIAFNACCQAMSNDESSFNLFNPVSCETAAWGLAEATLNDPQNMEENDFSLDVKAYIGVLLDVRGMTSIPQVMGFAIRTRNPMKNLEEYADDPRMFEGMLQNQLKTAESIDNYVLNRMNELFAELKELPLHQPVDLSTFKLSG